MIVHGGVHGDVSTARLPADAYPALFAYSLNRKLRYLYTGNYFRFRQESGGEFEYPETTPDLTENVYIVRIRDQKAKHGVPVRDAIQTDPSKQPKLINAVISVNDPSYTFPATNSYTLNPYFCLTQSCGLQPNNNHPKDHTFSIRPILVALQTAGGLTKGKYYEVKAVNTTNGGVNIWELGGASEVGWYQGTGRDTLWEIVNVTTGSQMNFSGFPSFSSPYTQIRVINKWHPHVPAGDDYDLVQVQITNGVLTNMKFGDTSAGAQWIGLGGGRGVDWEVQKASSEYRAVFDNKEYLDTLNLAPYIGQNFTITAIGDGGDLPRPMIGIWGASDVVTYEPSDLTTRFTFNSNMGSIIEQDGRVTQCFSGYDWTQNYTHVMSVKTEGEKAHRTRSTQNPSFTNISIGRQNNRLYVGTFTEAVMHLDELTKLGSDQLFTTTRTQYGY